jgi:hypothetical protein
MAHSSGRSIFRFGSEADTRSSRAFAIGIGIGAFLKKMLEEPFVALRSDGAQGTQALVLKP